MTRYILSVILSAIGSLVGAVLIIGSLTAPGWIIQGGGNGCIVDQTFSTPGTFTYTACTTESLTVETTSSGQGGAGKNIVNGGRDGGAGGKYAAGTLSFVAGQTYIVVVGWGGNGVSGGAPGRGNISYVCPTSNVNCNAGYATCWSTSMGNYPNWVCANVPANSPGYSNGATTYENGFGSNAGSGTGGSGGAGGGGSGSVSGDGTNGAASSNVCGSTGGAGGIQGGGNGGNGLCGAGDGTNGSSGSAPGGGGGGAGGGGPDPVSGGDGANGEVKIHI